MLVCWTILAISLPFSVGHVQHIFDLQRGQGNIHPLRSESFESLVNDTLREWKVPGLAIAIVNGNETHSKGFGYATYPDIEVTPKTLFGTGSTTKSHTVAGLSLLIDDNEKYPNLHWDTAISSVIPEDFVLTDEWATKHITLMDAMSHRTGSPRHDLAYGGPNATQRDVVRALRHLPLTEEPRTTFQYCNMMFAVLGHVIETLTGQWLGYFLRDHLWEPLGMTNTFLYLEDVTSYTEADEEVRLATGYSWIPDVNESASESVAKGHFAPGTPTNLDVASGAGAVLSNVEDYSKYLRAMLQESSPISKATYRELKTPRSIPPPQGNNRPWTGPSLYSLGWQYEIYEGHPTWSHGGSIPYYGAEMRYFPDDNWALVCLGNTLGTSNLACSILIGHLTEARFEIPEGRKTDWAGLIREIVKGGEARKDRHTVEDNLYPDAPKNKEARLPPSVPLAKLEGTFSHSGYQTINISTRIDQEHPHRLHVEMSPRALNLGVTLHHISGDWFLGELGMPLPASELESDPERYPYGDEASTDDFGRALFTIGVDGQASRVGLELEEAMVIKAHREKRPIEEGMIWFDRL